MTDKTKALRDLLDKVEDSIWPGDISDYVNGYENHMFAYKAFNGSLDAAKALMEGIFCCAYQVTVDWGPSGCGAKLVLWPEGLGGNVEIEVMGYDVDPARALLGAGIRAMLALGDQ